MRRRFLTLCVLLLAATIPAARAAETFNPYAGLGHLKTLFWINGYYGTGDTDKTLNMSEKDYRNFVIARVRQAYPDLPYKEVEVSKIDTKSAAEGRLYCVVMSVENEYVKMVAVHIKCSIGWLTTEIWSREQILIVGAVNVRDSVRNVTTELLEQGAGELYKARAARK